MLLYGLTLADQLRHRTHVGRVLFICNRDPETRSPRNATYLPDVARQEGTSTLIDAPL